MHRLTLAAADWRNDGLSPFTSHWFHHALLVCAVVIAVSAAAWAVRSVRHAAVDADLRRVWTVLAIVVPIAGPALWAVAQARLEERARTGPPPGT